MSDHPAVSADDLHTALRVLRHVAADRGALAVVDAEARVELQRLCGEVARPDLKQRKRLQRELLRTEKSDKKARDQELRQGTGIQQLRQAPVFQTPLPALPRPGPAAADWRPPTSESTDSVDDGEQRDAPALSEPRKCYVCKRSYRHLHAFYDQLCPACGDVSFAKRSPTFDLRGRHALVTGARVKIGYHAAILLLRNGCTVTVTTRFPKDAALRFSREPDFDNFRDRLHVYGLDLRHTPSVDAFAKHLDDTAPRLDFIVHNACQTVRRPPGFYAHLQPAEDAPVSDALRPLLARHEDLSSSQRHAGLLRSAALSQIDSDADWVGKDLLPAAASTLPALFPAGQLDADLQQIDLRTHNSWRLTLGEVPTLEMLEVLLVNAAAPFVLTAKLKPLLLRTPGRDKHVVCVSAMEGQFYREHKTDKHPHTNMAKAALNMMVRTSAVDYVRDGIHMNAVDTGWVTDEDPAALAVLKVQQHAFSPPLDVVDGAARIVDPIFAGLQSGVHAFGLFYKDYEVTPW